MKHMCQSSMVRCAVRGQHPRYVVYRFTMPSAGKAAAWVAWGPLRTTAVLVRRTDEYTLGEFLTELRRTLTPNAGRGRGPIPRDVTP